MGIIIYVFIEKEEKYTFWIPRLNLELDALFFISFRTGDVEIKLRNRGVDAFKHDEYGDSIIVQRKFSGDGGSQYRLKSKDGTLSDYFLWAVCSVAIFLKTFCWKMKEQQFVMST